MALNVLTVLAIAIVVAALCAIARSVDDIASALECIYQVVRTDMRSLDEPRQEPRREYGMWGDPDALPRPTEMGGPCG